MSATGPTCRPSDQFRQEVGTIEPEKLVFVDETGVNTVMTPVYARAPRGQRVVGSSPPHGDGHRDCGLGAGRGPCPVGVPRSTDTAVFQAYVDQVLVPELHQGDVVVFDNIKPHLTAQVAKSIAGAGAKVSRRHRTARTIPRSRRCSRSSSRISVEPRQDKDPAL